MTTRVTGTRSVDIWATAIVAGIIGGILIEVYLFIFMHYTLLGHWQFVASTLVGRDAAPNYTWLGGLVHYSVSIVWALIYVLLAQRWPALWKNPWLWGVLYGVVVMICMTSILIFRHLGSVPSGLQLLNSVTSHTLFFGLPVALYVSAAFHRAVGRR
jgi:hypothetical protein